MNDPKSAGRGRHNWGQTRRLAFIEFRLQWEGKVNRADIQDFFGISPPQATKDLREYSEIQGEGLGYDPRERAYRPTSRFQPRLSPGEADEYLHELIARWAGYTDEKSSFIGTLPSDNGLVSLPQRIVSSEILIDVLKAIRDGKAINVNYLSLSSGAGWRWIEPHALAWDGSRWHLRAYSRRRGEFRDFVLTRIYETGETEPATSSGRDDQLWHQFVTVKVGPHPDLSEHRRRALELDFRMDGGHCNIEIRAALVFYLFNRLGFPQSGWDAEPRVQQIELKNEDELLPILREVFPQYYSKQ